MSWSVFAALMGGTFGAAVVGLVQFLITRRDKKENDATEVANAIQLVNDKLEALRSEIAEDRATNARIRILSFSDEVRHAVKHSKESFDQINLDIDTYNHYCQSHPDYKNNRAVMAIANIERVYAKCLQGNDFLE